MHISHLFILSLIVSCGRDRPQPEEELRVPAVTYETVPDSMLSNAFHAGDTVASTPYNVILTGLPSERLTTFYRKGANVSAARSKRYSSYYDYEDTNDGVEEHFMPGIDLLYGYNLVNIGHYNMSSERFRYLFEQPVLVKSLYYPAFVQDSLDKKPINRDYFLISAYTHDSNGDSLINRNDLRGFFWFNADCSVREQLLPSEYSVVRSQYDKGNDVMYLFARLDKDGNGQIDKGDPMHVFWISLKKPEKAKRITR